MRKSHRSNRVARAAGRKWRRRVAATLAASAVGAVLASGLGAGTASAAPSQFTTHLSPTNTAFLVLDVSGGSTDPGAPVITWWANGGANQAWTFTLLAGGTYHISNQRSGQCLTTDGTAGHQLFQMPCTANPYQEWTSAIGPFYDFHIYDIVNPASGLAVDIYGNNPLPGASVDAWYPNGGANQQFRSV